MQRRSVLRLAGALFWGSATVAAGLLLGGCSSNPTYNTSLKEAPAYSNDFSAWIKKRGALPENLVALSFSGGGIRATALAASVAEQLQTLGLGENIAIVSSTSGGSVTAAFLAAKGAERLGELNAQFLQQDNQSSLAPRVLGGLITGSNRTLHFSSYLDERVFAGGPLTYGELAQRWDRAPFVILNASDMSTGQTFEFTQSSFSALCSDIASFRVSHAVAASAAFPFLMSPLTLRNHWNDPACKQGPAPYSKATFDSATERRYVDLERFVRARHDHALRYTYEPNASPPPYRRIEYVHLLDGGLSDNLAARALLRSFALNVDQLLANGVRRILLVQVNAKSDAPKAIDTSPSTPSLIDVFKSVALNPIDVTTSLSSYVSREYMVALVSSVNRRVSTGGRSQLQLYPVQVDFDQLDTASPEQTRAKELSTSWSLPAAEIGFLRAVGQNLLNGHPCFQAFARDAGVASVPTSQAEGCDEFVNIQIAQRMPPAAPPVMVPPPPPPATQVPLPAPPVPAKMAFMMSVLFDVDQAMLSTQARASLDEFKERLKDFSIERLRIVGFTDDTGPALYNQRLSEARAKAVQLHLISLGIPADLILTVGRGSVESGLIDRSESGRMSSRRVEIEVVVTRRP